MKAATKIRLVSIVLGCAALEAACRAGLIGRFTMVPPSRMLTSIAQILWSGRINDEIAATLSGVVIAAVSASLAGFLLGATLHAWPRARAAIDPFLATYYAIPIYVLYPMFLVLFGMNRIPIVVIGFMFAVVAMMTSTLNGLDRVPRALLKTALVLRMGWVSTVFRIVLPAASPYVLGGVKLATAYAFVGVLGAEFILSNSGLGYQIGLAFNNFDNPTMYGLILFVVFVVGSVNTALFAWERSLLRRQTR